MRLRVRAETHRRKWRAGAGRARTLAWCRQPGGKCKISPRGGEAGGDGEGPGEGKTLVWLAPPSLGSPEGSGVDVHTGLSSCLGPDRPALLAPENPPHPSGPAGRG